MTNIFLLFYSPKPRSQVWILIYRNWSKVWCGEPHNHRQPNLMMGGVHKLNCCTLCKIISKYENCDRRSRIANKEIELQSTILFFCLISYSYLLASQERLVWSILALYCGLCLKGDNAEKYSEVDNFRRKSRNNLIFIFRDYRLTSSLRHSCKIPNFKPTISRLHPKLLVPVYKIFSACMFCFLSSEHVLVFWEFAFCLFRNNALICTWIGRHLKEAILWGNIAWSEMMQKKGELYSIARWGIFKL